MLLNQIPSYFKMRRDRLMETSPGAAFVFPAYPESIRNSDVYHPYRQESNFYYLTGFEESGSCLVLVPSVSAGESHKTILFVQDRDPEKEMWEGERYGLEGAQQVFGADEAYPSSTLDEKLPELLKGAERVFYRLGIHGEMDRRMTSILDHHKRLMGRSGRGLLPVEDPYGVVSELRLFKSADEIKLMREGGRISAFAHREVMKEVRPGMNEREVEARVDFIFRKEGCQRLAYGSIVAGGRNATCLHYRLNNDVLRDGDLLLIDAGGEYGYYASDITRTFPIGRKFTPAQSKAYDLVLKAQKEAIAMTRPGVTLPEIHRHICKSMIDSLLSIGVLKGKSDELLKSGEYRRFYPHSTSHWLGMDVHDVGLYQKNGEARALEAGMVLTIEPGFYVQPTDFQISEEYRNIGIRIEDDILVTADGCENLTQGAPKERSEIESLRA